MNTPRFTAEASLYKSNAHYEVVARLAGLWHPGQLVQPAARPVAYCSMKGCCVDLRDMGLPRICCNGDECGPDVFV
jgi:hypothetical protein